MCVLKISHLIEMQSFPQIFSYLHDTLALPYRVHLGNQIGIDLLSFDFRVSIGFAEGVIFQRNFDRQEEVGRLTRYNMGSVL